MKTKAAIGYAAGKPLEITMVDLEGPRAGEVLVEIKATGVCHTDEFTRSGADPEGLFPAIFGHEGAGIVVDIGDRHSAIPTGHAASMEGYGIRRRTRAHRSSQDRGLVHGRQDQH
jgi:S-(hydroxymethyl)glutathione dehydrogenase/alcohol dehydrogenase